MNEALEIIRQFALEKITLARCAELLGVNIADAQFLRPLCPAVYSRADFEKDAGVLDMGNHCPSCGKPMARMASPGGWLEMCRTCNVGTPSGGPGGIHE